MKEQAGGARRRTITLVAVAAGLGYAWLATGGEPFEWPIRAYTALAGCVALALAVRAGWLRLHRSVDRLPSFDAITVTALVVWAILLGLVAFFAVATFMTPPRSIYPTLSSIANRVFEFRILRVAGFAGWLAFGWYVIRR